MTMLLMIDKSFIFSHKEISEATSPGLAVPQFRHFEVGQHARDSHYEDVNTCFPRVAVIGCNSFCS